MTVDVYTKHCTVLALGPKKNAALKCELCRTTTGTTLPYLLNAAIVARVKKSVLIEYCFTESADADTGRLKEFMQVVRAGRSDGPL